jgi:hypothetical protein
MLEKRIATANMDRPRDSQVAFDKFRKSGALSLIKSGQEIRITPKKLVIAIRE